MFGGYRDGVQDEGADGAKINRAAVSDKDYFSHGDNECFGHG